MERGAIFLPSLFLYSMLSALLGLPLRGPTWPCARMSNTLTEDQHMSIITDNIPLLLALRLTVQGSIVWYAMQQLIADVQI